MTDFGGALKSSDRYDFAVIGIPYDAKSSYRKGAAQGPRAIRESTTVDMINACTESGADLSRDAVLVDLGDVDVTGGYAEVARRIEERVFEVVSQGAVPLILGGDHAVTFPAVQGLSRGFPDLAVLHFDAHPDLYEEYQGDPYSHACPLARILEHKLAAEVVQVGIRAASPALRAQAARYNVRMIEMKDLNGEDLTLRFRRPVYISFDIDALDPAFAPGVSHLEPGGLSTRQALGILHRLEAEIVGMDVVEVNPGRDPTGITAAAAAKLVMEVAGKIAAQGLAR
jgi:agmatinase